MPNYEMYPQYQSPTMSSEPINYSTTGTETWELIALILAIIGGILVYYLFVKPKTVPKNKFAKWLKDFLSFKVIWLEPILKIIYYILTIFTVLFSFTFLGKFEVYGSITFLYFLISLILGPIFLRLAYEVGMMFIMIWSNTTAISKNTEKKK